LNKGWLCAVVILCITASFKLYASAGIRNT
jgi:hypothetical protein